MNILISVSLNKEMHINGLNQNAILLAELYSKLNHKVCLLNDTASSSNKNFNLKVIQSSEIDLFNPDVIIQCGFYLKNNLIFSLKKKNSKLKNIHVHYGNRMIADMEKIHTHHLMYPTKYVDQVWVSPHYKQSISYYKNIYKTKNIHIIPYIWSPKFLNTVSSNIESINIGILEPNINFTKNCLIPILICESLYKKNSSFSNSVKVYCSDYIKDKRFFRSWLSEFDIYKSGKLQLEHRKPFNQICSKECNVVLSHQIFNELNYLYLECFYLGIPLIHNSKTLKSSGFYYPNNNIEKGVTVLKKAIDQKLLNKKFDNKKILNNYSIENNRNLSLYAKLVS